LVFISLMAGLTACSGGNAAAAPVTPIAPSITTQPASQTVAVGQTATFSVMAKGTAPLRYQWKQNGMAIAGATSSSYTTPSAATSDSGSQFAVEVSNAAGTVSSTVATLTVNSASAPFNQVFIVVEENQSYSSVVGNSSMPYLNRLASQYGLATQYFANTHPSIGDYQMLTAGQVITNDDSYMPPSGGLNVDNVVRQLLLAGKTWKAYEEDLPSVGYLTPDVGNYARRHCPLSYFSDVMGSSVQIQNLVPFAQFANDLSNNQLPDYSFITPNLCNDAHDCPLATADNWLSVNIAPLIASGSFQQGGLLVIVFDEAATTDATNGGGHVAWIAVSPKAKGGYQSTALYQHQSTLRLMLEGLGIHSFPGAGATAPTMWEFFTFAPPS